MEKSILAARPLAAPELCRRCRPEDLPFRSTDELEELPGILGQARAVGAITFGVGMGSEGYNLYAMGPEGVGRHTIVHRHLEAQASARDTPPDWCYLYNFDTPYKPRAMRLPAGRALAFRRDMARLVEDLRVAVPAAFESEEYRARLREIEAEFSERRDAATDAVGEHAMAKGIALLRTPAGFGFAPRQGEGVMSPDDFAKLPEAERKRVEETIAALQEELESVILEIPKWRREAQHRLRELNRQVTRAAVKGLIEEMRAAYTPLPHVGEYLTSVQEDVLDKAELFRQPKDGEQPTLFGVPIVLPEAGESFLRRYEVNVLVHHEAGSGAPIVYEDNPTHANLLGPIEHIAQMGTLVTDFTRIKAGALHRANGGYLMLDALKLLTQPLAWDALKRALRSREIRMESLGHALSLISTVSLEPEPVPLDIKVVLVGARQLYYLLHAYDPEFGQLFKVPVDFEEDLPRDGATDLLYARMIATLVRQEKLRPLDAAAVARVIDYGARSTGDAEKLSIEMQDIADLLRESEYFARTASAAAIGFEHVQKAIDARIERLDRVRDRHQDHILRETILIDTAGTRVGQVNGLAVMQLGGLAFGMPHRISARVRLGGGRVVDIEREVALGGPVHSKGVLILSGFLAGRYALSRPLSLVASLVFEQSYGAVEGDSASSAELYALLSALADAPVRQAIAVTGSVNQHGDVQAIGGVNEKIEGYFDVCRARGLNGEQGVIIPLSNVKNLMLRRDVVEAVSEGRFAIYPVRTVDEGMTLLTGMAAGERDAAGQFPANSVNGRVERRLLAFAERARPVAVPAKKDHRRRGARQ